MTSNARLISANTQSIFKSLNCLKAVTKVVEAGIRNLAVGLQPTLKAVTHGRRESGSALQEQTGKGKISRRTGCKGALSRQVVGNLSKMASIRRRFQEVFF